MALIKFSDSSKPLAELARNLKEVSTCGGRAALIDSTWVTPLAVVPVCAMARSLEVIIDFADESNSADVRSYLKAVEFPNGTSEVAFSYRRSYLPLTRLDLPGSNVTLNQVVSEYVSLILAKSENSNRSDLRSAISHALGEMTTNVQEHARAKRYWLFAQYWPQKSALEFCIVDDGIGIRQRYSEEGMVFNNDKEALAAAIQGRSVKQPLSDLPGDRGYGLGSTIRLLTGAELGGSFLIISGDTGYVKRHNNTAQIFRFSAGWQGVMVGAKLRFPKQNLDILKYMQ